MFLTRKMIEVTCGKAEENKDSKFEGKLEALGKVQSNLVDPLEFEGAPKNYEDYLHFRRYFPTMEKKYE